MDTEPLPNADVPNVHPPQTLLLVAICACLLVPVIGLADQPKPVGEAFDVSTSQWSFVDGHLPMHITLSMGLRYPFVACKDDEMTSVGDETTTVGFPSHMSVDYVPVWRLAAPPKSTTAGTVDWTKAEYLKNEKAKWHTNGWVWKQAKMESNIVELDEHQDGIASGLERMNWSAKKN